MVVALSPLAVSANWFTAQLTDNSESDQGAQVSGNNVVWQGSDGNDDEIFLYNGSTVTTLTDNGEDDEEPQVSGNNVVWAGYDGNDLEIFLYNGSTVTTLTDNSYDDEDSQVSGNNVVWEGYDGNDKEIFLYDGSTVTTLTDNGYSDIAPQVSGNNVVWQGNAGSASEIMLYDSSSTITTTVTTNNNNDYYPRVDGNNVVWMGHDGNDWEIFLHDSSSTITTTLTATSLGEGQHQVSGNNVVWRVHDGSDFEIISYNGLTVTTLTDNGYDDAVPQVSGNNLVWQGNTGSASEIMLFNGSTVTTLTDNGYADEIPQVSGNSVVWQGKGGGSDYEIFWSVFDTTAPTDPTISSSSHQVDKWRSDNTIDLKVHPDATDAGSGVAGYSITFSKDTTEVPPQTISTTDTPNTTDTYTSPELADGQWYANLSTVDRAGYWTSAVHMGPFKIDATKPTASVKINNGAVYTNSDNVTLNISASDNLSGLYWMRVRNKGGEWSSWENFKTTKEWELSGASMTTLEGTEGIKEVELEVKDKAYNHSAIVSDTIKLDTQRPTVRMITPFVSTRISKTTTFKVKWSAEDPSPSSGMKSVRVYYRPSGSAKWRLWKTATASGQANFTGKAGKTYSFRTIAVDNARNWKWSKTYKTIVPFNEGMSLLRRTGFNGYKKLGKSQNYLSSVRYSYRAGHTLVYKLYNTNGIGLVVTKGPKMGRAEIYIDGKYVTTVDAYKSSTKARQLIYYKGFTKKGTHYLKVVNLGTPGRARFEVDAVVVKR